MRVKDLQRSEVPRTYLKNKIRVQGKARNGEKAEHTRSMWAFWTISQHLHGHLDCFWDRF